MDWREPLSLITCSNYWSLLMNIWTWRTPMLLLLQWWTKAKHSIVFHISWWLKISTICMSLSGCFSSLSHTWQNDPWSSTTKEHPQHLRIYLEVPPKVHFWEFFSSLLSTMGQHSVHKSPDSYSSHLVQQRRQSVKMLTVQNMPKICMQSMLMIFLKRKLLS